MTMTRRRKLILLSPLFLLGFLAFIGLGGFVVQQLWNWLLPPLFGWRPVTFWQAVGLLLLCRILFGGLGGRGASPRGRVRGRIGDRMAERWEGMTPEERDRLRQRIRGRQGLHPDAGEPGA